jgi:F-type H+-transporting ATPase subunit gamma
MDWNRLFSSLIRQFLFVSRNIEERLIELNTQFHQQRQMSITEELLDIVAGFEALTGEEASMDGGKKV